jgi:hypothetical protein
VYLNGDDIGTTMPKTRFTAMNQGEGYIFQHDPQCSWFEYDWLDGKTYGSEPMCTDLDKTVYAGNSNGGKPTTARCIVATGNLEKTPYAATGLGPQTVSYMCEQR